MKSKRQQKQQPKTSSRLTDIGDGEHAAELPNVQDNGGEQQAKDQPKADDEVGCFFRSPQNHLHALSGYL
jgi:hypothetical protein